MVSTVATLPRASELQAIGAQAAEDTQLLRGMADQARLTGLLAATRIEWTGNIQVHVPVRAAK